jgi:hypothetical protein
MIHIDVEQGSRAWLQAKVGIPSASSFHKILTPKTMKLSQSSDGYAHELLAEQVLGRPLDDATTEFMQRGTLLEKAARDWYSLQRDVDVTRVGFLMSDDRRVGCSPDGLVGEDGGLEIKCPSAPVHIGFLLGADADKHRCQVQGALWITGRSYWDFVSYNPEMPAALLRFERDAKFIAALAAALDQFHDSLTMWRAQLATLGLFPTLAAPERKSA